MGVVIPTGFAQISLRFLLSGDQEAMVVTMGCDAGSFDDPVELADVAFAAMVGSGTLWDPSTYSDEYQHGPYGCTIMTAGGPQTALGTQFEVGTNSGTLPLPNNTAILVQKRTVLGGRRGRGRAYFPPLFPTEGAVGPTGNIDSVALASWQSSMDAFLEAMSTATVPLYLLHDNVPSPLLPTLITALTVQPKVATQRGRLRR